MAHQISWVDVVVAGGGPAGLQAALMLGRSRREVLVADGGEPRNAVATAVHNLLGHEGVAPGDWLAAGRADVASYGVEILPVDVIDARRDGAHWTVRFSDDSLCRARALILATGLVEELPDVEGLAEHWGRDVVACPYCHGWEARGKAVAVLGSGPRAWQQLLLLQRFTDDLTLLGTGAHDLDIDQLRYLRHVGIDICADPVSRVLSKDDQLTGVEFASGEVLDREVLFAVTRRRQRSDLAARLGCTAAGETVVTDDAGRTNVPSVWAAGSTTNPSLTVAGSAGHASIVAIAVNNTLLDEEVAQVMRSGLVH